MAPNAQPPQVRRTPEVSAASSTTSGLAAIAVMNIAEVMIVTWYSVLIRYPPTLRAVSPGSDPRALAVERTMG